jgi:hypothetical protein
MTKPILGPQTADNNPVAQKRRIAAAKKQKKLNDARIQRLYGQRCSGIQIDIMDIGKVFKVAERAMAQQPDISDEQLGSEIAAYVEQIRKN